MFVIVPFPLRNLIPPYAFIFTPRISGTATVFRFCIFTVIVFIVSVVVSVVVVGSGTFGLGVRTST